MKNEKQDRHSALKKNMFVGDEVKTRKVGMTL